MNSFGNNFRVTIFGESHGVEIGVVVDGVPPGMALNEKDLMEDIDRRRSGARGTTPRKESDIPVIVSGVFNGFTTGAPVTILFRNENTRSSDYSQFSRHPRPGHADLVALCKFDGYSDYRGGGHFSGRITLPLVAAGVIAKKILKDVDIDIRASIVEIGGETDSEAMNDVIDRVVKEGDSCGGIIECRAVGMPIGLGEPFFNSVESVISHMVFSIPAVRGIEFGQGFDSARVKGSEHNDLIIDSDGGTATNNSGGVNGGISNGNDLVFRIAVKPTSSISKPQNTFNFHTKQVEELAVEGRHDACIALRVPVVLEAATAIALADLVYQG